MIPIVPNAKTIAYIVAAILIVALVYVYGGGIFNNGNGTKHINSELSNAQRESANAREGIGRVESGLKDSAAEAGRISEGVGTISSGLGQAANKLSGINDRIGNSQSQLRSAGDIIDEDQRILGDVQKRGPIKN